MRLLSVLLWQVVADAPACASGAFRTHVHYVVLQPETRAVPLLEVRSPAFYVRVLSGEALSVRLAVVVEPDRLSLRGRPLHRRLLSAGRYVLAPHRDGLRR